MVFRTRLGVVTENSEFVGDDPVEGNMDLVSEKDLLLRKLMANGVSGDVGFLSLASNFITIDFLGGVLGESG